ncbi:glutamate racemase [Flavobacterium sp. ASW18X]|uniref:glutamate racemase n=1 Tax=Flavobacterium sp. ASW18X TaxID=2572595 RepID=UPI0010AE18C0|nr:glutamate racemase [Flavobacterium sp. ASW18X]TKD66699.1 glutamate racemase [Flavobacterium sp. ASW18X]
MDNTPIGVFDSGIGGTSIWKELVDLMPLESTVFLADSANAPYGEKSKEQILELSIKNTELLVKNGAKLIVVACNTATTNAIAELRSTFDVPFIGIEPAIKPAALKTKTGVVGVLATKGTLSSSLFHSTTKIHASGIKVIEQVGTGLVDLIEGGKLHSSKMKTVLASYIKPMLVQGMDCLVLGCTHYPYLIPVLKELMPPDVTILDSGLAVAKQTKTVLAKNNLLAPESATISHYLYSNGDDKLLKEFVQHSDAEVSFLNF